MDVTIMDLKETVAMEETEEDVVDVEVNFKKT
jgi:hypothetical protein